MGSIANLTARKLLIALAVSSMVLQSCGGGGGQQANQPGDGGENNSSQSDVKEGFLCDTADAVGQTAENRELTCQLMGDGKLVWRPVGGGSSTGGAGGSGDVSAGGDATLAQIVGRGDCNKSSTVSKYGASIGDTSKMSHIYPMGGMIQTHITPVDHIYVYYPQTSEDHSVAAGSYLVTSPADGTISGI